MKKFLLILFVAFLFAGCSNQVDSPILIVQNKTPKADDANSDFVITGVKFDVYDFDSLNIGPEDSETLYLTKGIPSEPVTVSVTYTVGSKDYSTELKDQKKFGEHLFNVIKLKNETQGLKGLVWAE
ncbi:MAG: hypothetical protein J6X84_01380 [Treponema sp.]|nr:hypothetical protein [Treponema sp.]